MKSFTLIGGPAHGRTLRIDNTIDHLHTPVDEKGGGFTTTTYHRNTVKLPSGRAYHVFVHSDTGMPADMGPTFIMASGVPVYGN